MTWTLERVDLLKKHLADGLSASKIAKEIGGCTRNAVIGKVHRMGLVQPDKPKLGTITRPPRVTVPRQFKPLPKIVEPLQPPDESAFAVSIADIGMFQCRYPLNDPSLPDFKFCGAPKLEHSPYCYRHHRIAYQTPERRTPINSWRTA